MEQRDDAHQDDHQDQHHEVKDDDNVEVPLKAREEEQSSSAEQNESTIMDTTTSKSPGGEDLVTNNESGSSRNDNNNADNNDDDDADNDMNNNNNDDNNDNTENNNNNNESSNNFNSDELTTPEVVVEQLKSIAESGTLHIDWSDLQRALKIRLGNVLDHYMEKNRDSTTDEQYQEPNVEKFNLEHSRNELLELISSFAEAPFTIQRICELLYTPFKYYDKISTFLRGLEKNLRVISPATSPKNQIEPAPKNEGT